MKLSLNQQHALKWVQQHQMPDDRLLAQLFELIDLHFTGHRTVGFYSAELNVTPAMLNKLTQFYLDKTVHELLQERLLLVAQVMLRTTRLTVKEMTYELGFEDPGYFCRWFKKMTGMKVKEWRALCLLM